MDEAKKFTLPQALLGEAYGTFLLTFVNAALPCTDAPGPEGFGLLGRILGTPLVAMTLIFCLGEISGAHINPAVTLAFTLRRVFPRRRAFLYIAAQILGAACAAALARAIFDGLSFPYPQRSLRLAVALEFLGAFILVTTILMTSGEAHIEGWAAAFPVGFTLILGGLLAKDISGALFNPAKYLGLAMAGGNFRSYPIYLTPFLGAIVATGFTFLLIGPPKPQTTPR